MNKKQILDLYKTKCIKCPNTTNILVTIYENEKQMTGIIFDEDAIADFNKETKKYKKLIVIYVFSYDHTYNEEDFSDLDNLKAVKPIPEVILNVYRKIYKDLYKPRNL